jgi:hypothetical protein
LAIIVSWFARIDFWLDSKSSLGILNLLVVMCQSAGIIDVRCDDRIIQNGYLTTHTLVGDGGQPLVLELSQLGVLSSIK